MNRFVRRSEPKKEVAYNCLFQTRSRNNMNHVRRTHRPISHFRLREQTGHEERRGVSSPTSHVASAQRQSQSHLEHGHVAEYLTLHQMFRRVLRCSDLFWCADIAETAWAEEFPADKREIKSTQGYRSNIMLFKIVLDGIGMAQQSEWSWREMMTFIY